MPEGLKTHTAEFRSRTGLKPPLEGLHLNEQPCLAFSPSLSCFPPSHISLTREHVLNKSPVSESLSQVFLNPEHLSHRPLCFPREIASFLWPVFSQHLHGAHLPMAFGIQATVCLGLQPFLCPTCRFISGKYDSPANVGLIWDFVALET